MRSHGIILDEINQAIQDAAEISQEKLDALFEDVVARNQAYYEEVVTLAKVSEPQKYVEHEEIWAIYEQTKGELRNLTQSMGFMVRSGRHMTMLPPAKSYQWALDSSLLQVESGAISYNQAISGAVRQLADSGLCVAYDKDGNLLKNHVQYERGWHNHIDVAVRRAVLTGVNQINQKYREQSMDYLETDLIEVTAHLGARNIRRPGEPPWTAHTFFQGRVFHWERGI